MTKILLQGYLLGLAYLLPIGMQNMYVINTASKSTGRRVFQIALIASILDVLLAMACFYGIGLILERFEFFKTAMLGIGSVVVLLIGLKLVVSKVTLVGESGEEYGIGKLAAMLFAVTWLNPQAVIDGTFLLGGFKALLSPAESPFFIAGVAIASVSWFFGLAYGVYHLKRFMTAKVLRLVNIACGSMLVFFGARLGMEFFNAIK
ncbi:MAG: LysE family transporter [Peptostreptococcaceae bacterium]|nr:LysE family transporter [Peptostreptococcaceae bacterium]